MAPQPHDVFFHWVIAHPDEARAFLEAVLPPEIVAVVDWAGLEVDVGRIDAPELVTRVPDAVCRAPLLGGGAIEIAIVLEHQSTPEREMPFRMHVSQGMVWTEDARHGRAMSASIGLVLHHGPRPWNAPRTVRERLALPSTLDAALGPYLPSHPYLVVDLAGLGPEALARLPIRNPLVRTTLFALQRAREAAAIDEELALVADDLRAISVRPDAEQALTAVFGYLLAVVPEREEPIRSRLRRTFSPEFEEHIMGSSLKEHYEMGLAAGEALGEARGLARGELGARRETLVETLEVRFDRLPKWLSVRIADATREELRVWQARAVVAATLDEVFASRS